MEIIFLVDRCMGGGEGGGGGGGASLNLAMFTLASVASYLLHSYSWFYRFCVKQ